MLFYFVLSYVWITPDSTQGVTTSLCLGGHSQLYMGNPIYQACAQPVKLLPWSLNSLTDIKTKYRCEHLYMLRYLIWGWGLGHTCLCLRLIYDSVSGITPSNAWIKLCCPRDLIMFGYMQGKCLDCSNAFRPTNVSVFNIQNFPENNDLVHFKIFFITV